MQPTPDGTAHAPRWRLNPAHFCDELFAWMTVHGSTRYDPGVTQLEHALQSAFNTETAGGAPPLVVAALLHDVGHYLVGEHDGQSGFLERDLRHERVGAKFLARFFPPAVTEPVRFHVDAKRYLCATEAEYRHGLSKASQRSLVVQGDMMTEAQAAAFFAQPGAPEAVALRRYEDTAKTPGAEVPSLNHYRDRVIAQIIRS